MKLPSILRVPKHQRFRFEPRYYDPVKEDIEQRISKAKQELAAERREMDAELSDQHTTRISDAFARRRQRQPVTSKSGMPQAVLVVILTGGIFGYIYYGNVALYGLLATVAFYVYLRFRRTL